MRHPRFVLALSLLFFASSCGDETSTGPNGLTVADLAGTWSAASFIYSMAGTGPAIPAYDLIAEGGSVNLALEANGGFVLTTTDPDGLTEVGTGSLAFEEEDFMVITLDDEPGDFLDFLFVLESDDAFRLEDRVGQVEFDLDGDGTDEVVRLDIRFTRS